MASEPDIIVNTVSANGLHPLKKQTITWTNAHFFDNWTYSEQTQSNSNQNRNIFIQENAFEDVVWKMSVIFFRPQGEDPSCTETRIFRHV